MHGYGIAQAIKRLSDEVLTVEEGSLYPALQRLLLQGWVKAEWKMTETNRRARFYTLTAAGRKQLGVELSEFEQMIAAIGRVLERCVRPTMPISHVFRKLRLLFGRDSFRDELNEEMEFHRAAAEQAFVDDGMTAQAARYAARRQFGNATRLQEQSHEIVGFRMETVLQDLRFALRQLRRSPGIHADSSSGSRARDGRESGDLRLCGCRADQAAAVSRSGTAGGPLRSH